MAPVFQLKCEKCAQISLIDSVEQSDHFLVRNVCQSCQSPYPILGHEDFFWILALPRKFNLEQSELERRFYSLSRALHPDRFSTQSNSLKAASLQRMSLVNQAYTTLLSVSLRREYLLNLENIQGEKVIPQELSEAWFELQDLDSSSDEAKEQIKKLRADLANKKMEIESQILHLEKQYDHEYDTFLKLNGTFDSLKTTLVKVATAIQCQNYLSSLENEMARFHSV